MAEGAQSGQAALAGYHWPDIGEGPLSDRLARLGAALDALSRDPDGRGLVLVLRGRGAALDPAEAPAVAALARRIERFSRPVIAHLTGPVSGAEAALALAAHYRLADPGASMVFPEARFGHLPGAGITQRLPRLIGATEALRLMLGSRPEGAAVLLAMGALDAVAEGEAAAAVANLVAVAGERGLAPRPTGLRHEASRDGRGWLAACRAAASETGSAAGGAGAAIPRAVEAALLLPFPQGLAFESVTLEDLVALPETRALAVAARAEAAARGRLRAAQGANGGTVARLGLWQAGPGRADLVIAALARGLEVGVAAVDPAALRALLDRVATLQHDMVSRGTLAPEARDADWTRLRAHAGALALASASDLVLLVQEAGFTPADAGATPVAWLGTAPGPGWPGAPALLHAQVQGGHAELSLAGDASPAARAAVIALCRRMGWALQIVGPGGFIAPALRRTLRALPPLFDALGHDRRTIAEGLAAAGLGAVTLGPRPPLEGALREIGQMGLAALANEGAQLLAEGIAPSAADLDAAAVATGIMPRSMGGPLYQADLRGPLLLRADLVRLGGQGRMALSPAFADMLGAGRRFYG